MDENQFKKLGTYEDPDVLKKSFDQMLEKYMEENLAGADFEEFKTQIVSKIKEIYHVMITLDAMVINTISAKIKEAFAEAGITITDDDPTVH